MTRRRRIWLRWLRGATLGLGLLLAFLWGAGDRIFERRRITDGHRMRGPEAWSRAMRFVWDEDGEVLNGGEDEEFRGGEISVDGALVFARRQSPGGWTLWWRPPGESTPRPAFELDVPGHDVDPTWSRDGRRVVFASDREGGRGGFDLWIADRTEDGLARPRPLPGPVNTPFDERHPAIHPLTGAVVFSSNRRSENGSRFSLYVSRRDAKGFEPPQDFEPLSGWSGDAVAASFSADGRSLFFASEAPDGRGGYDLYRWIQGPSGLSRVEPLRALNGPGDELDPSVTPDGRRLLFVRCPEETPGLDGRLRVATIRELFQMSEAPGVWWRNLVRVLAALLLVLLCMLLVFRWGRLHPFIKFLLLSLVAHLLFLLFAPRPKEEIPEGGEGHASTYSFSMAREKDRGRRVSTSPTQDRLSPTARRRVDARWQPKGPAPRAASPSRPTSSSSWSAPPPARALTASPRRGTAVTAVPREKAALSGPVKPDRMPTAATIRPSSLPGEGKRSKAPSGLRGEPGSQSDPSRLVGPPDATAIAPPLPVASRPSPRLTPLEVGGNSPSARAPGHGELLRGDEPASLEAPVVARRLGPRHRESQTRAPGASGLPSAPVTRPGTKSPTPRPPRLALRGGASEPLTPGLESLTAAADEKVPAATSSEAPPLRSAPGPRRFDGRWAAGRGNDTAKLPGSVSPPMPEVSAPAAAGFRRGGAPAVPSPAGEGEWALGPAAAVTASTGGREVSRIAPSPATQRGPTSVRVPRSAGFERLAAVSRVAVSTGPSRPDAGGMRPPIPSASGVRRREVERPWPEIYAGRRGEAKRRALEEGGGSEVTEASVLSGLRYLAKKQRAHGGWGDGRVHEKYGDRRVGKTGLALLAFLGAGHDGRRTGEFQETVQRGLAYLLAEQRSNGHLGGGSSYGHGIATYALAEAWALTRAPQLRRPLGRAVRRILRAQYRGQGRLDGGWGYFYADESRRFDRYPRLSVSAWQIMALASAELGGIAGVRPALERAARFLEASWDPGLNAFRYNHDPQWLRSGYPTLPGSSAAAVFALGLLDPARDDALMTAGLRHILQMPPRFRWRKPPSRDFVARARGNLYFHYYAALALHRRGGRAWRRWNEDLKRLLTENQSRDGSWRPISPYAEYAGDWSGDRVYTTSLAVLTLEVYYRYLTPLLSRDAASSSPERESVVVVHEVRPGSTAERAGLSVGDVILEVNGNVVEKPGDLRRWLRGALGKAEATELLLRREGRLSRLRIQGPLGGLGVSLESSTRGRR